MKQLSLLNKLLKIIIKLMFLKMSEGFLDAESHWSDLVAIRKDFDKLQNKEQ